MNQIPSPARAGYIAIVGRPNVGKSTLVNALLKQKIAAVSPRPQTTRRNQLAILTLENVQLVLVDTPGLHIPRHKLGEAMNQTAIETLQDADAIAWLVDLSQPVDEEDRLIAARLAAMKKKPPILQVLNKTDLPATDTLAERRQDFAALLAEVDRIEVSALKGENLPALLDWLVNHLPEGVPFFDEDQVTDLFERDIAADLLREAALNNLREEVPHCVAVRIDEFTERGDTGAFIAATLFVEKESQKGIVIGKGGEMLKKIGAAARKEIEGMGGRRVFLELRVKVNKNWRDNPDALRQFGYLKDR